MSFFKSFFFVFTLLLSMNVNALLSINVSLKDTKTPLIFYNTKTTASNKNFNINYLKNKLSFFSNIKLYNGIDNKSCYENSKEIGLTSYCISSIIVKVSDHLYVYKGEVSYSNSNKKTTFEVPFNINKKSEATDAIVNSIYKIIFKKDTIFKSKAAYVKHYRKNGKYWYTLNVSNYNLSNEKRLLSSPEPITSLSWNKNNTKLAYVSYEKIRPAIFYYDFETKKKQKIISLKGINNTPSWSPDGKKIAFSLSKQIDSDIYIYNFASKKIIKLTKSKAIDTEPVWEDNNNILFTSSRKGNPRLYKVNIKNKKITEVKTNLNYLTTPSYRDGNVVSIVKNNKRNYSLYKIDLKTGKEKLLVNDFYAESPSISKDGEIVYYISKINGKNGIKAINMEGKYLFEIKGKNDIKDITISN